MTKQEKVRVEYIIQGMHSGIWNPLGTFEKLSQAAICLKQSRERPLNHTEHRLLVKTTIEEVIEV